MKLYEIAHSRTGDKGDISNISLIPWNEADYPMLKEQVTAQRVKEYFSEICLGKVTRYEADGICALNFVMEQALGGGVPIGAVLAKAEVPQFRAAGDGAVAVERRSV